MKDVIFIPGLGESVKNYKFRQNINVESPLDTIPRNYYLKEFKKQIDPIVHSIKSRVNHENVILSARSFGAYLLLQSFIELNRPFQGVLALFSPIFGFPLLYENKQGFPQFIGSKFKYAEILEVSLDKATFPSPAETHVFYGANDKQCDQSKCKQVCELAGTRPVILREKGHNLGLQFIESMIEKLADDDN